MIITDLKSNPRLTRSLYNISLTSIKSSLEKISQKNLPNFNPSKTASTYSLDPLEYIYKLKFYFNSYNI